MGQLSEFAVSFFCFASGLGILAVCIPIGMILLQAWKQVGANEGED